MAQVGLRSATIGLVLFSLSQIQVLGGEPTSEGMVRFRDLDAKQVHQLSNVDLAEYLMLRTAMDAEPASPADRIGRLARKTIGQRFRLNATRFCLSEGDCVSMVEATLALSLADDWPTYKGISERLRYKDGFVDYKNRNFFTLGDWLPSNTAWLLRDVTRELGGGKAAESFTHVVRPKVFEERPAAPGSKFVRIIFKGSDYQSPDKEVRSDFYIPRDKIAQIASELHTGDVVLVLRDAAGGHFGCDHMGLLLRQQDGVIAIVHAAPPAVQQQDLAAFLQKHPHIRGLKFLRLRDDAAAAATSEATRLTGALTNTDPLSEDKRVDALLRERKRQSTEDIVRSTNK